MRALGGVDMLDLPCLIPSEKSGQPFPRSRRFVALSLSTEHARASRFVATLH